jgi:hypothetical protein
MASTRCASAIDQAQAILILVAFWPTRDEMAGTAGLKLRMQSHVATVGDPR